MADCEKQGVELGFVELTESWRLLSHFFPSKVGGKPAWLALSDLPTDKDLACGRCGKPCIFLLQVYAPINELNTCFHRTLFVFICKDPACYKTNENCNFHVFRSQLARVNAFYSSESPVENELSVDHPRADKWQPLCLVCGSAGLKRCAKCRKATYCSKEHQTLHWKGQHKKLCQQGSTECSIEYSFPEFEIDTEPEEWEEEVEKTDEEKMKEYTELVSEMQDAEGAKLGEKSVEDLEKMARKETEEDEAFNHFKRRVDRYPQQILRYERGGSPLWVSNDGIPPPEAIPCCTCGASRQFEFQVMPQLLNELKVDSVGDSIDWGTLAVYTCINSCSSDAKYYREFLWKQDFSASDV